MAESTSPADFKARIEAQFNQLAPGYDDIRMVVRVADRLVQLADLKAGERVLDVGAGTGHVALRAAERVGPGGQVLGIDLSPEMVGQAQAKSKARGLGHLSFRVGDAERLDLPDGGFDVVLSASVIFFLPDPAAAVAEWARVLAPGGRLCFTSFGRGQRQVAQRFAQTLALFGPTRQTLADQGTEDPVRIRELVDAAGLAEAGVHVEQLGYYLPTFADYWDEMLGQLQGQAYHRLAPELQAAFKSKHRAEMAALTTPDGIFRDIETIFATGRKTA